MAYDTAIIIGMTGLVAIFFYLAKEMMERGDDKPISIPLSILFMFAGFFTMLANLTIMADMASGHAATQNIINGLYGPFLFMVIIVLAYVIITVIADVAGYALSWSGGKEEE